MLNTQDIYGPESSGDNSFAGKARLLQSWYRVHEFKQTDFGFGPEENSKTRYGNILIDGKNSGSNFLTPQIFEYAQYRTKFLKNGETIKEYRLYNNMLSSQPMCFNLIYPLKALFEKDDKSGTKIFQACFPSLDIKQILAVEIEYLPYPVHEFLNDRTAFDAMLIYKTNSNEKNILAIETKYVEKLGTNPSSDLSKQVDLVNKSHMFNDFGKKESEQGFGQLGRNFLLAEKYRIENKMDKAFAVTVSPKGNDSSKQEIKDFHKNMNESFHDRLFFEELENVVNAIKNTAPKLLSSWIEEFGKRYLAFEKVEHLLENNKRA